MGVPFLYRFLCEKYPCIKIEYKDRQKSKFQLDNIYIDCNGIIHPVYRECSSEEQIIKKFISEIDSLIKLFEPSKTVMLSFDGIAPLAKMKQQRMRRFNSENTKRCLKKIEDEYREMIMKSGVIPPKRTNEFDFDSNCISPGTAFMNKLCKEVKKYFLDTKKKRNYNVIVSGVNVVGEGEQKIIHYIRNNQRENPLETHCLIGLDADFILLGLSLHNPNLFIYRDRNQRNHKHILMSIMNLRTVIGKEFFDPNIPRDLNIERVIDDFIFLCNFFGNDFLPAAPFMSLRKNDLTIVIKRYRDAVWELEDYLVDREKINWKIVSKFMKDIETMEDFFLDNMSISKGDLKEIQEGLKNTEENKKEFNTLTDEEIIKETVSCFDSANDIMIKKIPKYATIDDVSDYFSQFGEIIQINMQKSVCFIRFKEKKSLDKVLLLFDQLKILDTPVKVYKVDIVPNNEVLVKNTSIEIEKVKSILEEKAGKIRKMFQKKNHQTKEKFFFVQFYDSSAAENALKLSTFLNGEKLIIEKNKFMSFSEYKRKIEKLENIFNGKIADRNCKGERYQKFLFEKSKQKVKYAFYKEKIPNFDKENGIKKEDIIIEYMKVLEWVMWYYFRNSCKTYRWCYPFYYAPFCSDLREFLEKNDLSNFQDKLVFSKEKGNFEPFKPLEQLCMILPKKSAEKMLPKSYVNEVVLKHPNIFDNSDIHLDFFRNTGIRTFIFWESIEILDSIDWERMLALIKDLELTEEEKERNKVRKNFFLHKNIEKVDEFDIKDNGEYQTKKIFGNPNTKLIVPRIQISFKYKKM